MLKLLYNYATIGTKIKKKWTCSFVQLGQSDWISPVVYQGNWCINLKLDNLLKKKMSILIIINTIIIVEYMHIDNYQYNYNCRVYAYLIESIFPTGTSLFIYGYIVIYHDL